MGIGIAAAGFGHFGGAKAVAADGLVTYDASAYGSQAMVLGLETLGRSAPAVIGCHAQPPAHSENTVAQVNGSPLITTGTVTDDADALAPAAGSQDARGTSTVQNINIANGSVVVTLIQTVSHATHDLTNGFGVAGSVNFAGLTVNGQGQGSTVAPNTRIDIPVVGYVVLNEQFAQVVQGEGASIIVNAIHVVVFPGKQGQPNGADVIVSSAHSALVQRNVSTVIGGDAYSTSVTALDGTVKSGPSWLIRLGCGGTDGEVKANPIQAFSTNGVVVGTGVNTVEGIVDATGVAGETTSTVQTLNIGNGLITADLIKADAHVSSSNGAVTTSDSGSQILNLSIQGFPQITGDPGPNSVFTIPGVGTLYLHRIILTKRSIAVRMIELVVTQDNPNGLPVNTDIRVAVARIAAAGGTLQ